MCFHKWHEYCPLDAQYKRYSSSAPSVIAARHRINDVYYAFADAEALIVFGLVKSNMAMS